MRGLACRQPTVNVPRSGGTYFLLAVVLLLGAGFRFYKIDEVGLAGSDTVYYTNIAQAWSAGVPVYQAVEYQKFVYRPIVFSIFGAAVHVLGFADPSIKLANATADLVNIGLMFVICLVLLRKDPWPAFAAALIYACSPMAIQMSRLEMTHVISTSMVLLALLFFLFHQVAAGVWQSRLYLTLSAVLTGFAVLSHEELVLTAVGYALFLGFAFLGSPRARADLEALFMNLVLFVGFLLFTCGHAFLLHKDFVVSKVLPKAGVEPFVKFQSYFGNLAKLLWNGILAHGSAFLLSLFILLLVYVVTKALRGKMEREHLSLCLPGILLICYATGYVKLLTFFRTRIFLPLFPLVIIFIVVWCDHLVARWGPAAVARRVLVLSIAFLAIFFNLTNYQNRSRYESATLAHRLPAAAALSLDPRPGLRQVQSQIYARTWARKIHDELAGKVNENARLLVTSSIFQPYPGRRVFQVDYYFGDNAVYLIDHSEPLDELISRYNVKYVLFTTRYPKHEFVTKERFARYTYNGEWILKSHKSLGASYGFKPGQYTMRKEWAFLKGYLERLGAKRIYAEGQEQMRVPGPLAKKSVDLLYELE